MGAFSESLAEWCMTVFLHFDKQMVRVQKNRADRKWDKFIMSELRGKTVGFVGFGSIAQATARLCRAFGMRILALRRSKEGPGSELADEVFSYEEARPPPTKAKGVAGSEDKGAETTEEPDRKNVPVADDASSLLRRKSSKLAEFHGDANEVQISPAIFCLCLSVTQWTPCRAAADDGMHVLEPDRHRR